MGYFRSSLGRVLKGTPGRPPELVPEEPTQAKSSRALRARCVAAVVGPASSVRQLARPGCRPRWVFKTLYEKGLVYRGFKARTLADCRTALHTPMRPSASPWATGPQSRHAGAQCCTVC